MKKVMVFGVFDGIHDGHRALFAQAKKVGDHLMVVVARDEVVEGLKGHRPAISLEKRASFLEREALVDAVLAGDLEQGTWEVVRTHKPDIIALGYDQQALKTDLELYLTKFELTPAVMVLEPYKPDELHSSLLNTAKG